MGIEPYSTDAAAHSEFWDSNYVVMAYHSGWVWLEMLEIAV